MPLSSRRFLVAALAAFAVAPVANAQLFANENFESYRHGTVLNQVLTYRESSVPFYTEVDPNGLDPRRTARSKYSLRFPAVQVPNYSYEAYNQFSYDPTIATQKILTVEAWIYFDPGQKSTGSFGLRLRRGPFGTDAASVGIDVSTGRLWMRNYSGSRVDSPVYATPGMWHRLTLQVNFATGLVDAGLDGGGIGLTTLVNGTGGIFAAPMFVNPGATPIDVYFDDYRVETRRKLIYFPPALRP